MDKAIMNKAIAERVAAMHEYQALIEKEINGLSNTFEEATGGLLSLCTLQTPGRIQLFHNTSEGSVDKVLSTLRELVDDGEITIEWTNKLIVCYKFKINSHPFCIVVDKEGRE